MTISETIENCVVCGESISEIKRRRKAIYCSIECSRKAQSIRFSKANGEERDERTNLPPGTVGAIKELVVCSFLMKTGFHVFRALSPSCLCDLVVIKEGKTTRVEVTTGYKNVGGSWSWTKHNKSNYDVLAIVFNWNDIKWIDSEDKEIEMM